MKRRHFLAGGLASSLGGAQRPEDWARQPKIVNRIANVCDPVPYTRQQIDPASYLGRRFLVNFHTGLLRTLDVDDYLRGYGEKPRMPPGEYLGKFVQGLARMYLYNGEAAARQRADKIVQTWLRVQSADGWLGSYQRFRSWDIWEHKYLLLGLLDYYALAGENSSPAWIRTTIHGSKGRCPTIRRPGNTDEASLYQVYRCEPASRNG